MSFLPILSGGAVTLHRRVPRRPFYANPYLELIIFRDFLFCKIKNETRLRRRKKMWRFLRVVGGLLCIRAYRAALMRGSFEYLQIPRDASNEKKKGNKGSVVNSYGRQSLRHDFAMLQISRKKMFISFFIHLGFCEASTSLSCEFLFEASFYGSFAIL